MVTNLQHLPPPEPRPGNEPDEFPRFGALLADAWAAKWINDAKPLAIDGTRVRLSYAGKCARDLSYWIGGLTPTDPMDLADHWRAGLGTMVHELLQERFTDAFPGATVEETVDLRPLGIDGSGHVDVVVRVDTHDDMGPRVIVVEVKTINGFGFKKAVGCAGPAEGPRSNALRQGAMAGVVLEADELVIIYLSLECLSAREWAKLGSVTPAQKFLAEWTYTREEFEPIGQAEFTRLQKVVEHVDAGKLPPRSIPDLPKGARVVDPMKGRWEIRGAQQQVIDAGSTWMCDYCPNRQRCVQDGPS